MNRCDRCGEEINSPGLCVDCLDNLCGENSEEEIARPELSFPRTKEPESSDEELRNQSERV
jgi:hypothetical protein